MKGWGLRLYCWLLFRRIPLVGGWLRRWAARSLARQGSAQAVHALANALVHGKDPRLCALARKTLAGLQGAVATNALGLFWAATRHPELEALLRGRENLPANPPEVRLLVALKLGRVEEARAVNRRTFVPLVQACQDRDPEIADHARTAIRALTDPSAIQALGEQWALTRAPLLEQILLDAGYVAPAGRVRLLTGLKTGQRLQLADLPPEGVDHLLAALEDTDATVREQAQALAAEVDEETRAALTAPLGTRWAQTRAPALAAVLIAGRHVPAEPLDVHVLCALKTDQGALLHGRDAVVVPPLLRACADEDPDIAARAVLTLRQLEHPEAREAVCRAFLDQGDEHAGTAAVAAGYAPEDDGHRALFFFLTGQWERYEALDFDRRLLHAVHEGATPALRQRILDKVRAAGRADFLTILAGADYRSRAGRATPAEADVLVQMLAEHRDWPRLWGLAFELPLRSSLRILHTLAREGWRPERPDERAAFESLAPLATGKMLSEKQLSEKLPPAVARAHTRVPGRVNDVTFSPTRPLIAVGTGRRKLVLWNYQTASREQVFRDFRHSIGRVAFTPDDTLLCAERTQGSSGQLTLHGWRDGERFAVRHRGPVKVLEPVCAGEALVAFRDHRVARLDTAGDRRLHDRRFHFWCRSARAGPGGKQVALLHRGVTLVDWPGLEMRAATPSQHQRGVISCAAFLGGRDAFAVGLHGGEVRLYRRHGDELRLGDLLLRHDSPLQAVAVVADGSVLLSASTDGVLHFTAWQERTPLGRVKVGGGRLTSLHVSPGGEFMAGGDSDSLLSLWDLRVMEVPLVLTQPLARSVPAHLMAVNALLADGDLPGPLGQALRYVQGALRHRFRFDVEVSEVRTIRAGDFDIEIE
jgi:hypothetical protein